MSHSENLSSLFSRIAREAGEEILLVYGSGAVARLKEDRSPVTDADERAEAIILARLAEALPDIPVVAEESASHGQTPVIGNRFILVDPLDGTKEFISRNGEFTVNIALIENGRPVAGVVFAPAIKTLYAADEAGAWRETPAGHAAIHVRPRPLEGLTALCSRSHPDPRSDAFLATLPIASRVEAGSSLKFCRIAEGSADVYPRFGPTMEWDIAAGHAVLAAAGGRVVQPDEGTIGYGKTDQAYRNGPFVAWGVAAV
jgi:3'(2'),5'-bisphosphate nucleotidase